MADDRYTRVTFRGFTLDKYTVSAILATEKVLGFRLVLRQGSYNAGNVWQSAGTHDGGGAVDINISNMSSTTIAKVVRVLRGRGCFAAWHRTALPNYWGPHIHAIQVGNTAASSGAKNQVTAYRNHRNGLANNAYDGTWRPDPIVAFAYPVTPKPVVLPDPWFELTEWNLAGFDAVYGKAHWDERWPGILADLAEMASDVYCLLEIPDGKLAAVKTSLKTIGYKVVVGTDGRYIVTKTGMKTGRTLKYTLPEDGPANDDKQIVLAEVWPTAGGNAVLIECGHLEFRDGATYDATRVTQAKQTMAKALATATLWGIRDDRVFFANDENSGTWVSSQAFGTMWPDAIKTAATTDNPAIATFTGWDGIAEIGARIDKVHAHKDRPIRSAGVRKKRVGDKLSDHLPTTVVVGKK